MRQIDRLNFDALMDQAEAAWREREKHNEPHPVCPHCEMDDDYDARELPLLTCWCGVCFRYHHDDYFHAPMGGPMEAEGP